MAILEENLKVLKWLMKKIPADTKWVLAGSSNLGLQGVDIKVNDIDIFTDERGANVFDKILKEYCTNEMAWKPTEKFRSYYGTYKVKNVEIDICGNYQHRLQTGEWSKLYDLENVKYFIYQKIKIPVMSLEEEQKGNEELLRIEKAQKIKDAIKRKNK